MVVFLAALLLFSSAPAAPVVAGEANDAAVTTALPDTISPAAAPDTIRRVARPDTVLPRPPVTVTAARRALSSVDAPARVTVLDRRAIEASGASSVARLLEERSGAFVRRYGSGGLSTLSLRGAGASQSLVLLGGHRITDPQLGHLDLTLLPALLFESVEVMHGGGSALYGTDAMGGVVNLRPRTASGAPTVVARTAAGAYGERSGSALASGRTGRFSGLVMGEYRRAEGDFPYTDETLIPPRRVRRQNADRRRLSLVSTGRYDGDDVQLRGGAWYTGAERGLPGATAAAPTGERQWDEALRLWGDARTPLAGGRLRVGGLLQRKKLRYYAPQSGIDDTGRTLIGSLRAGLRTGVGPHWRVTGGLTGGFGQARHPSLADDAREGRVGAFAGGMGRYGSLRLFPRLRTDTYFPAGGSKDREALAALSPELGANWKAASFSPGALTGSGTLHLKARVGRSFRRPTFNDRFWQPGGNPDLEAERGWSAETGLAFASSARRRDATRRAEVTLFARRTREEIVWQPSGDGYYAPINVRRVHVRGVEASLRERQRLSDNTALGGGLFYTFTDARNPNAPDHADPDDSSRGAPLRYVPRHRLKGHARAATGPLTLTLNARYTGRRYANSDGTRALDPFVVASAGLSAAHEIGGVRAELSLRVDNLLSTDYAILQNRPLPPRHARLQLTLGSGGK
jgi:iron complex outermembrane receptor protein